MELSASWSPMTAPKTYLLTPPAGVDNPFGCGMHSTDLIQGLKRLNGKLCIPLPEHYSSWFPGKAGGQTTIWLGRPPDPWEEDCPSLKITTFHLGHVPEFTQLGPRGRIIRRGWRSILEKCIKAGVASRRKVERIFNLRLDYDGQDKLCNLCLRRNRREKATSASGLCDTHDTVKKNLTKFRQIKEEETWRQRLY